jgi:hypothetical protein
VTTFIPPEMDIVTIEVRSNGMNFDLFYPRCRRCSWVGETLKTKGLAQVEAGVHLSAKCIEPAGEGANANAV